MHDTSYSSLTEDMLAKYNKVKPGDHAVRHELNEEEFASYAVT